jgi:putative transposase
MCDWRSLSQARWDCIYPGIFAPKYRKKALYGKARKHFGEILHDLCRQQVKILQNQLDLELD